MLVLMLRREIYCWPLTAVVPSVILALFTSFLAVVYGRSKNEFLRLFSMTRLVLIPALIVLKSALLIRMDCRVLLCCSRPELAPLFEETLIVDFLAAAPVYGRPKTFRESG